jgi:hypothetical protein
VHQKHLQWYLKWGGAAGALVAVVLAAIGSALARPMLVGVGAAVVLLSALALTRGLGQPSPLSSKDKPL